MAKANAVNDGAGVCLLDSTHYLRNQLLRDSDWASMAHSLELRTPLVDAALLDALKLCQTSFAGGAGKRLLAQSPASPLPEEIIQRKKSGFGVPMTQWLAAATERRDWSSMALLADRGTPWTRRWAKMVMDEEFKDGR
jgi:asparagine synthase (glutamine-hydrolysing)